MWVGNWWSLSVVVAVGYVVSCAVAAAVGGALVWHGVAVGTPSWSAPAAGPSSGQVCKDISANTI